MNTFSILLQKELKHYFNAPIAYVILVTFFLLTGWFFISPLFLINQTSMQFLFQIFPLLFIFFAPAVSMRLFAEEKRQGTLENLETLPISDTSIVLSKFFGALIFMCIGFLGIFLFPLTISGFGHVEWGVVFASFIGALLLVSSMISVGMFISTLTRNQIVAFIIACVLSMLFILASSLNQFLPWPFSTILSIFDFQGHFQSFTRGVIDIRDVAFFVSVTVIMILLSKESLDQRNS